MESETPPRPAAAAREPIAPRRLRRLAVAGRSAGLEPAAVARCVAAMTALGLLARLVRYAQGLPFWSDECFLASNFLGRGFLGLAKPLDNGQVAPLAFLWVERAAVLALGFSEWSLRLFPLVCGLASVVLFAIVARRALSGPATAAAVAIFAVSVHPIRHAAEVKPYASDALAALVLLAPALGWLARRDGSRRLWLLLGLLPPCLAFSNPAVFAAGGILIGLAAPVWRTGRAKERGALACCGLMLVGLSLAFHVGFGASQSAAAIEGLRRYWSPGFPPLGEPSKVPGWLLGSLAGSLFAYPGGGAKGASAATTLACLVGAISLARRGRGAMVVALSAPLALNLVAAGLGLYPFGPEARLAQYAAPAICILAGAGVGAMLETIRRPRLRRAAAIAGLAGMVGCAVVPQVHSWLNPYRMPHDLEARAFARSFWPELSRDAVVACAHLDFGLERPGTWQGQRAWYLCNQAVWSPSRREGGPRLDEVSDDRPLRCVLFNEDPSRPEIAAWLARMQSDYRLRSAREIPVRSTFGDRGSTVVETWRVYEFTPLPSAAASVPTNPGEIPG